MKSLSDFPDAHLRIFDRPDLPDPDSIEDVYLIGICGTGMGSLAGLFRQAGYRVRGSDAATYPPMSTRLHEMGAQVIEGYRASNLDGRPGLVVVGNACIPKHSEATRAREERLPQGSFPEVLAHFFIREKRSLVIAGTHGKTTTTGMLVHILKESGRDPSFLIGGVMANDDRSFGLGKGPHFVVEGDEYDSAYFDKRPKFMHYRPVCAAVTSMEFDHADIYDDWEDYRDAFREFAGIVSTDGVLALNGDDPDVRDLAAFSSAPVRIFGIDSDDVAVRASHLKTTSEGTRFRLTIDSESAGDLLVPMGGRHNVLNALAALTIGLEEGLSVHEMTRALASFQGMKRRQEVIAQIKGVTLVDDFAHHPTAVRETISAVRGRWPGRKIIAAFEPRSNSSRRKVFEKPYVDAFTGADSVMICRPPFRHNDRPENFMDVDRISDELNRRGVESAALDDADAILDRIVAEAAPSDVILIMSNGGFGNIHKKLAAALRQRESAGATTARDAE